MYYHDYDEVKFEEKTNYRALVATLHADGWSPPRMI